MINLEQLIFEALGQASMCWESPEKAGKFDEQQANKIGEDLLNKIESYIKLRESSK